MDLDRKVADLYQGVKPDETGEHQSVHTSLLEKICAVYEQCAAEMNLFKLQIQSLGPNLGYTESVKARVKYALQKELSQFPDEVFSQDVLSAFCIALLRYQNSSSFEVKSGIFLSTLLSFFAEKTSNAEYVLPLEHFEKPPQHLFASCNSLKCTVQGNCGDYFAKNARDCNIRVVGALGKYAVKSLFRSTVAIEGNVDSLGVGMSRSSVTIYGSVIEGDTGTGHHISKILVAGTVKGSIAEGMNGGEIIVIGDVHGNVGEQMCETHVNENDEKVEALVHVYGNVHGFVGENSHGGCIYVDGTNPPQLGVKVKAEVYHQGKRVWPR